MFTVAGIVAALGGILALMRFFGLLSIFGPAIGAFLVPFADLLARAFTGAIVSVGRGLRICLTNITAFWVLVPLIFLSGAFVFGYVDPYKLRATKKELAAVHKENAEFRKARNLPPRKSKLLPSTKSASADVGETSKSTNNPFSWPLSGQE